jgi:predicted  nucleic acid-binding Zn-ribbon protein
VLLIFNIEKVDGRLLVNISRKEQKTDQQRSGGRAMFCGKCGAKNDDNAEFCTSCGAKLKKYVPGAESTVSVSYQNDKKHRGGIIAALIAVAAVIILGVVLFGGRGYKTTIKKYADATFDADAGAIFDLIPDKVVDYEMEQDEVDSDDLKDTVDEANEMLQDQLDSIDSYFGEGWKVTYKILDVENIRGDDLDEIKDAYKDAGVRVSAAKQVKVEFTVKKDETENSNSMDVSLIKVGRSWYLDVMSMGDLF